MSKKILITGGSGFLGSVLQKEAVKRDWCSEIVSPRSSQYDLRSLDAALQCMSEHTPDIIIHAAAHCGGIELNVNHPGALFYDNVLMGANVLEAARISNIEKVVVVGTICSYPIDAPNPIHELSLWNGMPSGATSAYGIAKRALLAQCQAYRKEYDLHSAYVILTNLYGPEDNFLEANSHVVAALIKKFLEAKKNGEKAVTVWGDGSASRDFLFVEDAARGLIDAAEKYDNSDPVNLGSGQEVSIKHLAETIRELTEFSGEIVWDTSKPTGHPQRYLDISRAEAELQFKPQVRLEEGLQRTIDWYKSSLA